MKNNKLLLFSGLLLATLVGCDGAEVKLNSSGSRLEITSASDIAVYENSEGIFYTAELNVELDSSISFSISGGIDQEAFDLDQNSGELAFSSPPDAERPKDTNGDNLYYVQVMARDEQSQDYINLEVTVIDISDEGSEGDGGGGQSSEADQIAIAGQVVDGYIQGANVCLDLDSDYDCSDELPELQTTSDEDGNYQLSIDADQLSGNSTYRVLAAGGYDLTAQKDFAGQLSALLETASNPNGQLAEIIVTPISSAIDAIFASGQASSLAESNTLAAEFFALDVDELSTDPLAYFDEHDQADPFYQNSKFIKAAEFLSNELGLNIAQASASSSSPSNFQQIYQALVANVAETTFDELADVSLAGAEHDLANELDILDAEVRQFTEPPAAGATFFSAEVDEVITNHQQSMGSMDAADKELNALDFLSEALLLAANISLSSVTTDLNLPPMGKYRTEIIWHSSEPDYLNAETGAVTRPSTETGDIQLLLTAVSKKGEGMGYTREFNIIIKAEELPVFQAVGADKDWLVLEIILGNNRSVQAVTTDLALPTAGPSGSSIDWESANSSIIDNQGRLMAHSLSSSTEVQLTASISKSTDNISSRTSKVFTVTIAAAQSDSDLLSEAAQDLDTSDLLLNNVSAQALTSDIYLPSEWLHGVQLSWQSSAAELISAAGVVSSPELDTEVKLTALLTLGSTKIRKSFSFSVSGDTGAAALAADFADLSFSSIKQHNTAANAITTALHCYTRAAHGSQVSWQSSNPSVIANDCSIQRPSNGIDAPVTIAAVLTNKQLSMSKSFNLTVLASGFDSSTALSQDYAWLDFNAIRQINSSRSAITSSLLLARSAPYGSSITWSSSNFDLISNAGHVRRPSAAAGDQSVRLTASISLAGQSLSKDFDLLVLALPSIDSSFNFSQAVYNSAGSSAQYYLRYSGQTYRVELVSNLMLSSASISHSAVELYLQLNEKLYPQAIKLPADYRNANVKLAFYFPHDASGANVFTSKSFTLQSATNTLIIDDFAYEDKDKYMPQIPEVGGERVGGMAGF